MINNQSKILVVEDDASWLEIYDEALSSEGYKVVPATTRDEAMARLDQESFAWVVVDLNIPANMTDREPQFENGFAVVDHVRKQNAKTNLYVNTSHPDMVNALRQLRTPLGLANAEVAMKVDSHRSIKDLQAAVRKQSRPRPNDIVMKFGGTSMGTPDSMRSVIGIVRTYIERTSVPCTVVVSAMSKVTDALIACARDAQAGNFEAAQKRLGEICQKHLDAAKSLIADKALQDEYAHFIENAKQDLTLRLQSVMHLNELSTRTLDTISSYGERLSAPLLSCALRDQGINSVAVDATRVIVTDNVFGSASPLLDETERKAEEVLKPLLDEGIVPVVTGFIGATQDGTLTTLGRGGSDFSATIVGHALNAKEVLIYTDVSGVKSADPNLVPSAKLIPHMSYERAAELTYHGAKVLYSRSLVPVKQKQIVLRVLNTFAPDDEGTLVGPIESVTFTDDVLVPYSGLALVSVSGDIDHSPIQLMGAKALETLTREDIEVMICSQGFSQRTVAIAVRETDAERAMAALNRAFRDDKTATIEVRHKVAAVSIVGEVLPDIGLIGRFLSNLGQAKINVFGMTAVPEDKSFSVLVEQSQMKQAVAAAANAMTEPPTPKLIFTHK